MMRIGHCAGATTRTTASCRFLAPIFAPWETPAMRDDRPREPEAGRLDPAQVDGLTDVDAAAFRAMLHQVADEMADYWEGIERRPVFPDVEPGSIGPLFPQHPPEAPASMAMILQDIRELVEPNSTAWNHPGFMAYFPTSSSAAGIAGEMLMASVAQNLFLWRTSPIGTELETVVVSWLRQALGLPDGFDGFFNDTASIGSLIALAAARETAGLDAASRGLAGRPELARPRVYASAEAHSSIDKACMTLGLGRDALVHVATDDQLCMRVEALEEAIATDIAADHQPIAIVATLGTTASTSVDPIAQLARIAERTGLWLHVDAAYAGVAALLPERRAEFEGWQRADSIVINPHKWLFTPFDASLLLSRRMPAIRSAFSLVPEYLRTLDRAAPVRDVSEYTPQLGRRNRALKLWVLLRWFGLEGLRRRLRHHLEQARDVASWVDADPDFERLAPSPFTVVCVRWRPAELAARTGEAELEAFLDERNQAILEAVNRTGEVFMSHARLDGRFVIRFALGHLRTEDRHVARGWELLREASERLADELGRAPAGQPEPALG
jgi:aromatic-L-amino-acid/L-tryptophan decarboxylase